ncbi:hypothetical protein IJ531_00440, partial [bacterium]|nr:hypothetical protein [bacterium]
STINGLSQGVTMDKKPDELDLFLYERKIDKFDTHFRFTQDNEPELYQAGCKQTSEGKFLSEDWHFVGDSINYTKDAEFDSLGLRASQGANVFMDSDGTLCVDNYGAINGVAADSSWQFSDGLLDICKIGNERIINSQGTLYYR